MSFMSFSEKKMPKPETRRIAILGAGPIGLEAAIYARKLGFPVTIFERGQIGEHIRHWGHVRMFSPLGMNSTPLGRALVSSVPGEADLLTGREYWSGYLEPLAKSDLLRECLQTETAVLSVARSGLLKADYPGDARRAQHSFRILVRKGQAERVEEADIVLDCSGTYGQHRWLGDGGIPAVAEQGAESHISYWLDDILGARRDHYAGKSVLLIGSGYSAATSAGLLATLAEKHPDMWVTWLARGARSQPLPRLPNDPLKERDRLALRANSLATRGDGNVEFHAQTFVQSVQWNNGTFKIQAVSGEKERTWEAERLIANVGYSPNTNLYRELQVQDCYATLAPANLAAALAKHGTSDCLTMPSMGPQALRNTEPDFYILGTKSYGRNSHFLLKNGFEQIREVFTLICGKADLNLYKAGK
jgi:thioredoxin reductase